MQIDDSTEVKFREPVRRLRGGGIEAGISIIYETFLPFPQKSEAFNNWIEDGESNEIP